MNPGDMHWIYFLAGGGHEQAGRRPAIILQDNVYAGASPLAIVVPLTGVTAAAQFAGTSFIEPDANNQL